MTNYNGGWGNYSDRPSPRTFFRSDDTSTKTITVKSGQVLKKHSFVETDTTGKAIAHSGINEKALVTFADIAGTKTVILMGLTFTAGAGGALKADLVTAFSNLTAGMTAAQANTANPVAGGTFTAGTAAGYSTFKSSTANSVLFVSTTPNAGVTDLADSGNGTGTTIVVSSVNSPIKPIAGILVNDVDASGGDVQATVYTEASFWADALVWGVDPKTDTIPKYDGTTIACTDYYTGAVTDDLKRKFTEGTEFAELGISKAGEVY